MGKVQCGYRFCVLFLTNELAKIALQTPCNTLRSYIVFNCFFFLSFLPSHGRFRSEGQQSRVHGTGNLSDELAGQDDWTARGVFAHAQREQRRRSHSGTCSTCSAKPAPTNLFLFTYRSFPLQTTSSEATFVCLLAARTQAIRRIQEINPELEDVDINSRLVAYCSDQVPG